MTSVCDIVKIVKVSFGIKIYMVLIGFEFYLLFLRYRVIIREFSCIVITFINDFGVYHIYAMVQFSCLIGDIRALQSP